MGKREKRMSMVAARRAAFGQVLCHRCHDNQLCYFSAFRDGWKAAIAHAVPRQPSRRRKDHA